MQKLRWSLICLLIAALGPVAMAQDEAQDLVPAQEYTQELEEMGILENDLPPVEEELEIEEDLLGALLAGEFDTLQRRRWDRRDRDHMRRDRRSRDDVRRDRRRARRHFPRFPGYERRYRDREAYFVCWSRDARGRTYEAAGYFPRRVQDRAMFRCERYARFCYSLGCRRYFR